MTVCFGTDLSRALGNEGVPVDDVRFVENNIPVKAVATSHGQNDSGVFELNFRDERYLPFECAGAISEWRIEMPRDTNAFDFDSITDVVLRINYTARDGGQELRGLARTSLGLDSPHPLSPAVAPRAMHRLFSLKHEFATEWYRFLAARPEVAEVNFWPPGRPGCGPVFTFWPDGAVSPLTSARLSPTVAACF